jgi:2-oxoglutarate ferredoxin oxidoreductase subunit gamma
MIAGFGGQGVLFAGQLLAYAGMDLGKHVTWIPSYGPEMRGGTANCMVVISDEEIGSPLVRNPKALIAMNLPSLDKYEKMVDQGGLIIVNSSIVDRKVERGDVRAIHVPGNDIAERIGDSRMTNMVLLGCLIANLQVMPVEALAKALTEHLPARHQRLVASNLEAIKEGAGYGEEKLSAISSQPSA